MNKTRMIITAATITMATVFAAPVAMADPTSPVPASPGLDEVTEVIEDIVENTCEDMHWEPCPVPLDDDMHW
jgi:hypothetical protein